MADLSTGRLLSRKTHSESQAVTPEQAVLPKTRQPIKDTSWLTVLLAILVSVVGFCYISWLTGSDLTDAITFFDKKGFEKTFFIVLIIAIVLIGIKMDILSWKPIRNLLIAGMVIMFFHLLGASIWPSWNPRGYLQGEKEDVSQEKEGEGKNEDKKEKVIRFSKPGIFTFRVGPYEKIEPSFLVSEGLRYNVVSEKAGDDFFLVTAGKTFHCNKDKMNLPDPIGSFNIMNGGEKTVITLLITEL